MVPGICFFRSSHVYIRTPSSGPRIKIRCDSFAQSRIQGGMQPIPNGRGFSGRGTQGVVGELALSNTMYNIHVINSGGQLGSRYELNPSSLLRSLPSQFHGRGEESTFPIPPLSIFLGQEGLNFIHLLGTRILDLCHMDRATLFKT